MTTQAITTEAAIRHLLAESLTTPKQLADVIEGAEYCESEDAIILSPQTWHADDGNSEDQYDDCDDGAEAAERYVQGGDWGSDEAEISVDVWRVGITGDGEDVDCDRDSHTIMINKGGTELARQKEMEIVVSLRHEFTTDFVGRVRDHGYDTEDTYYRWSRNGGSRGAHDRMQGDGVWREMYQMPELMTLTEAVAEMDKLRMDDESIAADMDKAGYRDEDIIAAMRSAGWDDERVEAAGLEIASDDAE